MNNKRILLTLGSIGFLFLLLFFPSISIKGSKTGLLLWFQILIPTLLPFFILSSLLRTLFTAKMKSVKQASPKTTGFFIVLGLFSGYPIGAKIIGDEYLLGEISYKNAMFFLSFCNQASPMFILVYVGMQSLQLETLRYILYFTVLLSSFLGSLLCSRFMTVELTPPIQKKLILPNIKTENTSLSKQVDQIVLDSFITITKIGGYVILFSILAGFTSYVTRGNSYITILFSGLLEVTTGINSIPIARIPFTHKIVLASILTTFGGFSAIAQTKSVIGKTGLSIRIYLFSKLISACFACIFSLLLIYFF